MSQVVLITGCSTGIGHCLARRLTQAGYLIAATARSVETLETLPVALKIALDVTVSDSVNGTYSATKFALEALSDALQLELAPFGIQVIVVEPGAIQSHFDDTAQSHANDILLNPASPYRQLYLHTRHPKSRYLAAISFQGRLVLYLRDFLWGSVARQMFKIHAVEVQQ